VIEVVMEKAGVFEGLGYLVRGGGPDAVPAGVLVLVDVVVERRSGFR
jgi:hypothetical protein